MRSPHKDSAIFVIAPDRPSGDAFATAFVREHVPVELFDAKIAPRVLGDKMNPSPKVAKDLSEAIVEGYKRGHTVVIACNTVQLWLDQAALHIPNIFPHMKIHTTIEAVKTAYPDRKKRPLWLGTTVLVAALPKEDFDTLLTKKMPDLQAQLQEIIWRVKGVTGADVTTAGDDIHDIANPDVLRGHTLRFIAALKKHGIVQVVLGCTELPIAFFTYADAKDRTGLECVDPAVLLAQQLKKQL